MSLTCSVQSWTKWSILAHCGNLTQISWNAHSIGCTPDGISPSLYLYYYYYSSNIVLWIILLILWWCGTGSTCLAQQHANMVLITYSCSPIHSIASASCKKNVLILRAANSQYNFFMLLCPSNQLNFAGLLTLLHSTPSCSFLLHQASCWLAWC